MTSKIESAARMALEALEEMFHSNSTKVAVEKYNTAHNALREALAEPELNLNCKSVQKRLATVWGYVKAEQAEQEPIRFIWNGEGWIEADDYIWKTTDDYERRILYAAPVRTKDLNDDEIRFWIGRFPFLLNEESEKWVIGLARAVIAADREKNNLCERTK